jgi:hypothetical protein
LKYCKYFELYVLYKWQDSDSVQDNESLENANHVSRWQATTKVLRLQMISPTAGEIGELFYVRCLLTRQAARSFPQLRTVDGIFTLLFMRPRWRSVSSAMKMKATTLLSTQLRHFVPQDRYTFYSAELSKKGFLPHHFGTRLSSPLHKTSLQAFAPKNED